MQIDLGHAKKGDFIGAFEFLNAEFECYKVSGLSSIGSRVSSLQVGTVAEKLVYRTEKKMLLDAARSRE